VRARLTQLWARIRESTLFLRAYVGVLAAGALAVLVAVWIHFGVAPMAGRWIEFWVLVGVLCFAEMKPITVVRSDGVDEIVASTTFAFAILISFGPVPALLSQALASVAADFRERKPAIKVVFNVSQYWLAWGGAAWAFTSIDRAPLAFTAQSLTVRWNIAVAAGGLMYFLINNVLVGVAMALSASEPIGRTVHSTIVSEWSSDFVLLALTPIVAIVTRHSMVELPVLLLPILAVYRSATISAEKEHLALHDSLTDLPNRFSFASTLNRRIEQTAAKSKAAVMLIDLDRFKEVNDTLGHQAGDDLLRLIGPRIKEVLPVGGTVARLGGDEFAVLLSELTDDHEALDIARRIGKQLDVPFHLEGFNIEVEASIGIAIYPSDGANGDTLMKRADVAMYVAKTQRTTVERYDPQLDHHSTRRLAMVGDLRSAINDGDIVVYYQPKLDLVTGDVREVEALVRWVHPRLGVVTPSEFVPLAEHTGLIRPLTSHVLKEVVQQAAEWRVNALTLAVAVNLSARSLHDGTILQEVLAVLNEHRLPPSLLRIEITESSIMADPLRARKVLEQLNDMGIRLSIDDFGTGYSSLSYLRELPVSEIKIDRSFVTNVLENEGDQVIVRSTIDLARNLGLTSVAEGVESAAALRWLSAAGCNQAQGYHIARPMTAAALTEWMRAPQIGVPPPVTMIPSIMPDARADGTDRAGNVLPFLSSYSAHGS